MARVKLTDVKKVYDNKVTAVHDFNLDIKDKEFIVFVGPSGCGKSTTLRMVAGLEDISGGTVEIDGEVVNDLQPKDRDIAMVFPAFLERSEGQCGIYCGADALRPAGWKILFPDFCDGRGLRSDGYLCLCENQRRGNSKVGSDSDHRLEQLECWCYSGVYPS